MEQLVLAVQAVQFGEVHAPVVVTGEGVPVAALSQAAQPAQLHPARLRQVAMGGEEALDLRGAGRIEAVGQVVVGEVGRQRVVTQRLGVAQVGATVALGQRALGFVVQLALRERSAAWARSMTAVQNSRQTRKRGSRPRMILPGDGDNGDERLA